VAHASPGSAWEAKPEGGEESVELFDVHRPAVLAAIEEFSEAVEFGNGQRLDLGEGSQLCCGILRQVSCVSFLPSGWL
jgi:hypothetical protein